MTDTAWKVQQRTSHATADSRQVLGRLGLVGKGVVYLLVGFLALHLALGDRGTDASQTGAVEYVAHQPFGRFLLVALTAALFAMALWRLLEVVTGDPVEGSEPKDRVHFAVAGLLYLALAISALAITMANWGQESSGGGGSGSGGQQQTAQVLEWPGGRWLVGLGGAALIALAVYTAKKHVIDKEFAQRISEPDDGVVARLGQAGYAARSVVYTIVGVFFVQAAITFDPEKAKGLSESLRSLADSGWGQVVLWAVALGLMAFGFFTLAGARYRRAT
jgi:succinate dehydrogenase/fumarate reductase cytochrome b subunit